MKTCAETSGPCSTSTLPQHQKKSGTHHFSLLERSADSANPRKRMKLRFSRRLIKWPMHQPVCSSHSKRILHVETGRWRLQRRRLVQQRDSAYGLRRASDALLVGLFLHPSLHFFRRDLFDVGGDSPVVTKRIFDASAAVAVELVLRLANRGCTCLQC